MRLLEKIASFPAYSLLTENQRSVANTELCDRVTEVSERCSLKDSRVCAIDMGLGIESLVAFLALAKARWVLYPYVGDYKGEGFLYADAQFDFSQMRTQLVEQRKSSKVLDNFLETQAAGLILSSSGTTGKPKLLLHNLDVLLAKYLKLQSRLQTVLVFPLNHVSGIETWLSVMSAGGTIHLPSNSHPSTVHRYLESLPIDFISCTPSYVKLLLLQAGEAAGLGQLKFINLGGELTKRTDLDKFRRALPEVEFRQAFGTTETTNFRMFGTDGEFMNLGEEGHGYKVIDGLLWLKLPVSMVGDLEQGPHDNDWFCTGDLVQKSEEGLIRFLGRKTDVIVVGGEKVMPMEVEERLQQHPAVEHARVFGKGNAVLGQIVCARLVVRESVSAQELRVFCRKFLPDYKVPFKLYFEDEIRVSQRLKEARE